MSKVPPVFGDYEKVKCDDFVNGIIEEVQENEKHEFKFQGKVTVFHGIRFKFILDGYEYPHFSRWNKFNLGDQSNLFNKYLLALVEGAEPVKDKDSKFNGFDIQQLTGMAVKTLWKEKNGFQSVETIRPLNGKIVPKLDAVETEAPQDRFNDPEDDHGIVESEQEEVPF